MNHRKFVNNILKLYFVFKPVTMTIELFLHQDIIWHKWIILNPHFGVGVMQGNHSPYRNAIK